MNQAIVSLVLLLLTTVATADCEKPYQVEVPDGATASKEEMIEAQKAIKSYMSDAQSYLDCLDHANKQLATAILSEEAIEEERAITTRRYNAMVDEMTLLAERFNVQVRTYKAANPQ